MIYLYRFSPTILIQLLKFLINYLKKNILHKYDYKKKHKYDSNTHKYENTISKKYVKQKTYRSFKGESKSSI